MASCVCIEIVFIIRDRQRTVKSAPALKNKVISWDEFTLIVIKIIRGKTCTNEATL